MRVAAWCLVSLFTVVLAPACSGKYTTLPGEPGEQPSKIIDCSDYLACDIDTPCDTGDCLSIPGCGTAVCVSASVVCDQACDSNRCAVLDSYPGQISSCPDGTPIKGKGRGESYPQVSTGGGPSYAGSVSTGGSYTAGYWGGGSGGYASGGYAVGGTGSVSTLNCQAYSRCNASVACTGAGFDCVSIPGCQLGICAPASALCDSICAGPCEVLESYPVQLDCFTNKIYGYEGFAGSGGASAGGSPGHYAGEAGYAGYGGYGGDFDGSYGGEP